MQLYRYRTNSRCRWYIRLSTNPTITNPYELRITKYVCIENSLLRKKMASEVAVRNIDNACETAEEFTRVFYKQVDNSRHLTSKLYLDTGLLVWNGNGVNGSDKIQKFLMDLPASNHVLKTLDAQPITDTLVANKLTYLIQACGDVTYQNEDTKKPFQQTFLIVAVEGKWKIASDCFRLQVPYNS